MFQLQEIKISKKVLAVFLVSTLCLCIIHYFGSVDFFLNFLSNIGLNSIKDTLEKTVNHNGDSNLRRLIFWITIIDIFYLIIPAILIIFIFKQKLSDYGLRLKLEPNWWKIYFLFMLIMFPLVFIFSGTETFQAKYPFYHIPKGNSLWPNFFLWELFYFSQFFCLEFFFRGFMIHGLKKEIGFYSILVMTIPYCMIHFGKPFPETISAIIAGLVLGYISYRNRSIFLGFLLHITVALSMDLISLWRKGFFD